MFGKKKREAEAKALAEAKAKEAAKKRKPTASWRKVPGPAPVARPADYIQLTPIIQPIPLVPYNTQEQPLVMYDGFDYVDDEE